MTSTPSTTILSPTQPSKEREGPLSSLSPTFVSCATNSRCGNASPSTMGLPYPLFKEKESVSKDQSSLNQVIPSSLSHELPTVSIPPSLRHESPSSPDLVANNLEATEKELMVENSAQLVNQFPSNLSTIQNGNKAWTSFFTKPDLVSLKYTPPMTKEKYLQLPMGLAQLGEAKWENTLVGFFIDKKLPHQLVIDRVNYAWSNLGLVNAYSDKKGFFFFKFNSKENCDKVLKKGPWLIAKHALFLKPWTRDFDFNLPKFIVVTTWVKLFNIPTLY